MSYTNHTTNYNLPQYIGTDKPTYLGDFNTAMGAIDTQMKANADSASAAASTATSASNAIGALANLTTTDKTSVVNAINEVDGEAATAQTTANNAGTAAASAAATANAAAAAIAKFNLTSTSTLSPSTNKGTVEGVTAVGFATDSTNSIFKVYGRLQVGSINNQTGINITVGTTTLRPTTAYSINAAALVCRIYLDKTSDVVPMTINVATNGVITLDTINQANLDRVIVSLPPCVYFNTDFGD